MTDDETNYSKYIKLAESKLSEKRLQHSLNVADTAVELAKLNNVDINKAYLAGILHDLYKEVDLKEQLQWIQKSGIILDSILLKQPQVWHGISASIYMKDVLNIKDEQILNAVRYHTTAREGMSTLEEIIYVSDVISADRKYPDVELMRKLAFTNLRLAMISTLKYSIIRLVQKGFGISDDTYRAYNYYIK
ncbi:MAG: bis(5'-nucleosyl)-tetraphosphatase (symmetrical) YqeK [Oscillospiraceae bacterium]